MARRLCFMTKEVGHILLGGCFVSEVTVCG